MGISDKYHLLYFLFVSGILSCYDTGHQNQVFDSVIDYHVKVNPAIGNDTTIGPLMIQHIPEAKYYPDRENITGNFLDDTIVITFGKPDGFGVFLTEIKIIGTEFSITERNFGCVTDNKYASIFQELVCNKSRYRIGDTLVSHIRYFGVYYSKGDYWPNDTVYIEGAFRCIIQDSLFTFQKLTREEKFNRIKKWAHESPDSITSLNWTLDTLCELPPELGKFTSLYKLNLSGCDLSNADLQVLGKLATLFELNLGKTNLHVVPHGILSMKHLRRLKLDENCIVEIPDSLYCLPDITVLNLSDNLITVVSDSIYKLRQLTELRLDGNPIIRLPGAIAHLPYLDRLFPPSNLDSLVLSLVNTLEPGRDYSGIGNFEEFKDNILEPGKFKFRIDTSNSKFTFPW